MERTMGEEILELKRISYGDLQDATSSSLHTTIMEELGPRGPGIIAITDVPHLQQLRNSLLPLARKLSLMDHSCCLSILKDHGLGTDVSLKKPDRNVSAFASQLKFSARKDTIENIEESLSDSQEKSKISNIDHHESKVNTSNEFTQNDFEKLGSDFKRLGLLMVDVGILLAKACDQAIGGTDLEKVILESNTAKGRLIHYHSHNERTELMDCANRKNKRKVQSSKIAKPDTEKVQSSKIAKQDTEVTNKHTNRSTDSNVDDLWQQWHYDYGIFTLITAPYFLSANDDQPKIKNGSAMTVQVAEECFPPYVHTYLKIFQSFLGKIMFVKLPLDGLILQVGEAAEIFSAGKLHATAHCVCRPTGRRDLSRETFVVFLQPDWNKCLPSPMISEANDENVSDGSNNLNDRFIDDVKHLNLEKNIPKISSLNDRTSSEDGAVESNKSPDANELFKNSNGVLLQSSKDINAIGEHRSRVIQEIKMIVPPLASRWKEGQTFAEFSRVTTNQYYGTGGVQSRKT